MRSWMIRFTVVALLICGSVAAWRYIYRDEIRAEAAMELEKELSAIIIPHFELHDATFAEALNYLESEARRAGLRSRIRFAKLSDEEGRKLFRRRISSATPTEIPNLEQPSATSDPGELHGTESAKPPALVTVSLKNIPVNEAIKYIASLAGLEIRITHDSVQFVRAPEDFGTIDPVIKREYSVRTGFLSRFANSAPKLPNGRVDARGFFESIAVEFYEGTSAEYDPATDKVIVLNTARQLDALSVNCSGPEPTFFDHLRYRIRSIFRRDPPQPPAIPGPPPPQPGTETSYDAGSATSPSAIPD